MSPDAYGSPFGEGDGQDFSPHRPASVKDRGKGREMGGEIDGGHIARLLS